MNETETRQLAKVITFLKFQIVQTRDHIDDLKELNNASEARAYIDAHVTTVAALRDAVRQLERFLEKHGAVDTGANERQALAPHSLAFAFHNAGETSGAAKLLGALHNQENK